MTQIIKIVERHVEVVNEAAKNIDPDRIRLHPCWGNYEGPHHMDVPMRAIVDLVLKGRASIISFERRQTTPRAPVERLAGRELSDGKILMPGVIDSTTNFIEHPELVSQRIQDYARLVGKENVIAGVDCGLGTNAASATVDARIVWAKLRTILEGARMATKALW